MSSMIIQYDLSGTSARVRSYDHSAISGEGAIEIRYPGFVLLLVFRSWILDRISAFLGNGCHCKLVATQFDIRTWELDTVYTYVNAAIPSHLPWQNWQ